MTREHIRHLPVVRAGALIGMLSDRDVLARGTIGTDGTVHVPPHTTVAEAMTPTPLLTCEASTDVQELARAMTEQKIDAIPVVHGLRLVGLVTSTDLLGLLLDRAIPSRCPSSSDSSRIRARTREARVACVMMQELRVSRGRHAPRATPSRVARVARTMHRAAP
jgi:acetoin utilization protein AcuB